ncbi:MAG: 4,5-DOPA dioxygenase extradiol [Bdellovibrionaceae bacterium]|nr:4,5-DOPA dioxygenase extradiol [Bdellovibrio sp.]
MPALFIGHGSPMNAVQDNAFTQTLTRLGAKLPRPKAIVVISAHWTTEGTFITSAKKPKLIYDMYGFPEELYKIKYEAAGDENLAREIQLKTEPTTVHFDDGHWGLDHGAWGILKYLFPKADIPVLQMSIDINQGPRHHFELGKKLQQWRESGVLIIGSGNVVHNLKKISWKQDEKPFDWAVEFDEWFKKKLIDRDFAAISHDFNKTSSGQLSVPTLEHYFPIHYILGAAKATDELSFEFEGMQNGSISMRAFKFG